MPKLSPKIAKTHSQNLESLKAFIPKEKRIEKIIKYCCLFPKKDWKNWTDYSGYSLRVSDEKTFITYRDKQDRKVLDIYAKATLEFLLNRSKKVIICFGKRSDDIDVYYLFIFGGDGILRTGYVANNIWHRRSPLYFKYGTLKFIIKKENAEGVLLDAPKVIKGNKIYAVWASERK